jgi:hypothetical protein
MREECWAKIRVTNNAANGGRKICSENKGLSQILNQFTMLDQNLGV